MSVQFYSAAIAFLLYLGMVLFVYVKDKAHPVNRHFALMLLCVALWNLDVAGIRGAPTADFAEIWGSIFRIGLLFIPPTFLHFVLVFTNSGDIPRNSRGLLISIYIISCFFGIINWTPHFTGDAKEYPWGYSVQSGPLYPLFILEFLICVALSFYYLIAAYIKANKYTRNRIKYFFLAIIASFILGSLNFLPMFGLEVYPVGSIAISVGLLIATYSVVQHRLVDVSVFLSKILGYLLSIIILGVPASIFIALLQKSHFQKIDFWFTAILVVIGTIAALLFEKIKNRVNQALQNIIVKDKYFYHQILRDFSRRLVTIIDLGRLLITLGETIEKSMGVKDLYVFLFNPEKEIFLPAMVRGESAKTVGGLSFRKELHSIQLLEKERRILVKAEIENMPRNRVRDDFLEFLKLFPAEVCLPLIYLDRFVGFINLGHKAEEEMYFREDLDLLGSLAIQVAMAIENANLYENLKKSQLMMRRTDRLASLGTLIAGLAHEIRNPLVSIKTFTQLLPERMDDEEFRNYFLTVASGEIDRLTTLINELLGFAKPTEPNLKGEDVNSIIDKMEFLASTEAKKKNITITKNYSSNLPPVMADAEQIKQVLLNILLNGMQAIEGDQGQVWIETRVVRIAREAGIDPFVQIEIRDNGAGISKENLDHIFDPFFTTRPEGSGLGLSITYQIVHEHGGFIDVESEVGKGTSFRVNFPLKAGENGGPKPQ